MNSQLIIFVRNPELGKVKTRLAKKIGDAAALAIYLKLLSHTRAVTENIDCDKAVYYSTFVDSEDQWDNRKYQKYLQKGGDLGEKMAHAIHTALVSGYDSVCLIGTDNYELTKEIIDKAFDTLKSHDVVIGPAKDGGYYLIGMNKAHTDLFNLKEWSTQTVFSETLKIIKQKNLTYGQTKPLNDIDVVEDLRGTGLMDI